MQKTARGWRQTRYRNEIYFLLPFLDPWAPNSCHWFCKPCKHGWTNSVLLTTVSVFQLTISLHSKRAQTDLSNWSCTCSVLAETSHWFSQQPCLQSHWEYSCCCRAQWHTSLVNEPENDEVRMSLCLCPVGKMFLISPSPLCIYMEASMLLSFDAVLKGAHVNVQY